MQELWKPVVGYEQLYEVSNTGKARKINGKLLKQYINKGGYPKVSLYRNGKGRDTFVHRMVAEAFIPNPRGVKMVNHIDECKTNNNVDNLEWVTPHENNYHGTARKRISETLKGYFKENSHHSRKAIRCVETGQVYQGVRVASRDLEINAGDISSCISGKRQTAGGYHWETV